MVRRSSAILLLCLACVAFLPAAGRAVEPAPRDGFFVGLGIGGGSLSWENLDGDRASEMSAIYSGRAGWALKPDLLLGLEVWGWAKNYDILLTSGDQSIDARFLAYTAAVTWYPNNGGFHLRGGLGAGKLNLDSESESAVLVETKGGFTVLGAMGWETYFTPHFALGADGTVTYTAAEIYGISNKMFGYGLAAQFNWYW